MKTKLVIRVFLGITLAGCLLVCTMCKKKDADTLPALQSQRIVGATIYIYDQEAWKIDYHYSGNLLTEMLEYDSAGTFGYKTILQYAGSVISSYDLYSMEYGAWKKESFSEIKGYAGDNPLEIIVHLYDDAGVEQHQQKTTYTYDGALLKKMERFYGDNGGWNLIDITTYAYDGSGRIIQLSDTGNNNYYGKITTYAYDANHMTESVTRDNNSGNLTNSTKTTYAYTGNRLTAATEYQWNSTAWVYDGGIEFAYNDAGNLVSEQYEGSGFWGSIRIAFSYGAGSGNFRHYSKITGNVILPGDPNPYPVKSGGPRFSTRFTQLENIPVRNLTR